MNERVVELLGSERLRWGLLSISVCVFAFGQIPLVRGSNLQLVAPRSYTVSDSEWGRSYRFQVINQDGEEGPFFVSFSVPSGGVTTRRLRSGLGEVPYQIYASPTAVVPLRDFPDVRAGEVLRAQASADMRRMELGFVVRFPGTHWVTPGRYHDSVVLRLFVGTLDAPEEVATAQVDLVYEVGDRINMGLVSRGTSANGGGGVGMLDFGFIHGQRTRNAACWVVSNGAYQVSIDSESGGWMVSEDGDKLDYTFRWDGVTVNLVGRHEHRPPVSYGMTDERGREHGIAVTVLPDENQSAGDYRDSVRISIWAP